MAELLVCADDFGLGAGIDDAVQELVEQQRLGAVSCMTNLERWPQAGVRAAQLRGRALVGLHLNLSEGRPASAALARRWPELPGLPRLLVAAHLRRLPLADIEQEIDAQWQAFEQATGGPPDFVDGHQHVHHLPGVREFVLARAARAGIGLRSTARTAGPASALKRAVIERSGGRALARQARAAGVPVNGVLLGAYGFEGDYRALMQRWLAAAPEQGGLLFCHPARQAVPADPISPARLREYEYLRGEAFALDLERAGVRLVRNWPRSG